MEIKVTEKVVKEVEITKELYDECDKCQQRIKTDIYDSFECSFKYQEGNIFPEGGYIDESTMDLCQECGEQLVEILKSLGYRINFREISI